MSITFDCKCGKRLMAKEEFVGRRTRCPACSALTTIPAAAAPAKVPQTQPTRNSLIAKANDTRQAPSSASSAIRTTPKQPPTQQKKKTEEQILDALPAETEVQDFEIIDDDSSQEGQSQEYEIIEDEPGFEVVDEEGDKERERRKERLRDPRKRKKRRVRDEDEEEPYHRHRGGFGDGEGWGTNAGVAGGLVMMVVAVSWFALGLYAGRIYFLYPPILFVVGSIAVMKGLMGGD